MRCSGPLNTHLNVPRSTTEVLLTTGTARIGFGETCCFACQCTRDFPIEIRVNCIIEQGVFHRTIHRTIQPCADPHVASWPSIVGLQVEAFIHGSVLGSFKRRPCQCSPVRCGPATHKIQRPQVHSLGGAHRQPAKPKQKRRGDAEYTAQPPAHPPIPRGRRSLYRHRFFNGRFPSFGCSYKPSTPPAS